LETKKELRSRILQLESERDAALGRIDELERELREGAGDQDSLFGAFFVNAAAGMAEMDQEGRFLRANEEFCRICGYSWEELERMSMSELTHPDDREEDLRKFEDFQREATPTYETEKRHLRKDGRVAWIHVSAGKVRAEGRPRRTAAVVRDITLQKQAQQAAEEASRAKSEFLANMSHEIRTPMTVFMAALDHLLQIDRSPERRPFLEMADQAAQRLRALIDDILDFSRIEARRLDIQDEPFDLRACIRNSVAMMELKAREKNLGLEMDVSPEIPPLVSGDPDRLGQVLINLMGNAVKFTSEGEVKISVRLRGKDIEFAISDTGIGIPAEKREQLFQSFSQADSSFTRRFGGTGLGLAISKGLVELMGGRIGVRSRPGGGSVFFFDLPMKPVAGPIPSKERVEAAEASFSEAHILIADDEPMIREMVLMTLAQRGWQAEIAVTGREAVRKWEEGNFDVVFMDLQMPEMDGLEATRRIREMENRIGRKTCIVGLTAHARPEVREQCLEAGMDMVLTKPVRMNELYSAIEDCLNI
jgi:PAS domain S-box-containing protein